MFAPCSVFGGDVAVEDTFCVDCKIPCSALAVAVGPHATHRTRPLLDRITQYPIELWTDELSQLKDCCQHVHRAVAAEVESRDVAIEEERANLLRIDEAMEALVVEKRKVAETVEKLTAERAHAVANLAHVAVEEVCRVAETRLIPLVVDPLREPLRHVSHGAAVVSKLASIQQAMIAEVNALRVAATSWTARPFQPSGTSAASLAVFSGDHHQHSLRNCSTQLTGVGTQRVSAPAGGLRRSPTNVSSGSAPPARLIITDDLASAAGVGHDRSWDTSPIDGVVANAAAQLHIAPLPTQPYASAVSHSHATTTAPTAGHDRGEATVAAPPADWTHGRPWDVPLGIGHEQQQHRTARTTGGHHDQKADALRTNGMTAPRPLAARPFVMPHSPTSDVTRDAPISDAAATTSAPFAAPTSALLRSLDAEVASTVGTDRSFQSDTATATSAAGGHDGRGHHQRHHDSTSPSPLDTFESLRQCAHLSNRARNSAVLVTAVEAIESLLVELEQRVRGVPPSVSSATSRSSLLGDRVDRNTAAAHLSEIERLCREDRTLIHLVRKAKRASGRGAAALRGGPAAL